MVNYRDFEAIKNRLHCSTLIKCDIVGGTPNKTASDEEEDYLNQEIRQGWFIWTDTLMFYKYRPDIGD